MIEIAFLYGYAAFLMTAWALMTETEGSWPMRVLCCFLVSWALPALGALGAAFWIAGKMQTTLSKWKPSSIRAVIADKPLARMNRGHASNVSC